MQPPVSPAAGPAVPPPVPQRQYFPSVTQSVPVASVSRSPVDGASVDGPPAAPPQARKIARFVSAEAAQSTLKLAADGQLPQLQLQDTDANSKGQGKSRSIPPVVMILAWLFSVAISVVIVIPISDNDSPENTSQAKKKAMADIQDPQFFGDPTRGELLPYQRMLREAQQAYVRRDFKAERRHYKQVLDLLHTETFGGASRQAGPNRLAKGVTGSREHDLELERLILKVLAD